MNEGRALAGLIRSAVNSHTVNAAVSTDETLELANVWVRRVGAELAADVDATTTIIPVDDPIPFADGPTEATVTDGETSETFTIVSVDEDACTLTVVRDLGAAWSAGAEVYVLPESWQTFVDAWYCDDTGEDSGVLEAIPISAAMAARLVLGTRERGYGERVIARKLNASGAAHDWLVEAFADGAQRPLIAPVIRDEWDETSPVDDAIASVGVAQGAADAAAAAVVVAQAAADAAMGTGGAAATAASEAQTTATAANTAASEAQSAATAANTAASEAQSAATAASTAAATAQSAADAAAADAVAAGETGGDASAAAAAAQAAADAAAAAAVAAQTTATAAATAAATANTAAGTAAAAAAAAQTAANTANSSIGDIYSDDTLTPNDKQIFRGQWDALVLEHPSLDAQADAYGAISAIDSAQASLDTWYTFLGFSLNNSVAWSIGGAVPTLIATVTTTSVMGSGFGSSLRTFFGSYYNKRVLLLKAIADQAKVISDTVAAAAAASTAAAAAAQTTADGAGTRADQAIADAAAKARTFFVQPTTPYGLGDLFFDSGGIIKKCWTARATGAYVETDFLAWGLQADFVAANVAMSSPHIVGGDMTAGLFRTAASGRRLEVDYGDAPVELVSQKTGTAQVNGGAMYDVSPPYQSIAVTSGQSVVGVVFSCHGNPMSSPEGGAVAARMQLKTSGGAVVADIPFITGDGTTPVPMTLRFAVYVVPVGVSSLRLSVMLEDFTGSSVHLAANTANPYAGGSWSLVSGTDVYFALLGQQPRGQIRAYDALDNLAATLSVGDDGIFAVDGNLAVTGNLTAASTSSAPWVSMINLANSWVNYGTSPAAYNRLGNVVTLGGLVRSGTNASRIVTFPTGYKPAYPVLTHALCGGNVMARLDINIAGDLSVTIPTGGNNTYLSFDSVSFRVA